MEPYDNKARKKEKEIEAAAAAAVERGIDNNDGVPKPKKSRRKLLQETVLESDVVLAKEKRKDKTRVKSSAAIEDAAQETRSEVKEIRKNVTVLDDSDVFPGGSPAPDGTSRKSESKAGEREKAAPRAPDNTVAVETALVPDKGDKKSKKSKKRRHAESLLVDDETTTPALDVTAEGQSLRKKRHKGNSKIIDPGQDKSLSEQALKGMFVSIVLGLSELRLHYSSFLCLLPIRKSSRVEIQQSEAKLAHSQCLVTRHGSSGYKIAWMSQLIALSDTR